jgi:cellulose synthase/poly-beta-1,6-N-acetylglucosamine synthase-like glycosyltransferase
MVQSFWLALGLVVYTYVGYGALMGLLARLRPPRPAPPDDFTPPVTLVIPAYNEAAVVAAKLENCRSLDYPRDKLALLFVTDGSTDGTAEMLAQVADVTLLHLPTRQGKPAAMNRALAHIAAHAPTPVTVFSDANTLLNPDALRLLVRHFADPDVGCVAGEKRVSAAVRAGASAAGESLYWRYESTVKRWESAVGNVMGAAGELFAIRTMWYVPLPEDTLIDDFVLSFKIAQQGKRLVYEPAAYGQEGASASIGEEWKRKTRISAGGIQAITRLAPLLNPRRYGFLSFQYISHRVLRWTLTPVALLLLLPLNGLLAWRRGPIYRVLLAAQALFYAAAWLGWRLETRRVRVKLLFAPFYFTLMQAAVFVGLWRFVRGRQDVRWERARRAE